MLAATLSPRALGQLGQCGTDHAITGHSGARPPAVPL